MILYVGVGDINKYLYPVAQLLKYGSSNEGHGFYLTH